MEEPRKLHRSQTQRMIAGVCGGLAEYFNLDATLMRVLFLLLAVFGGSGIVIYIVMWIIVLTQARPRRPSDGVRASRLNLPARVRSPHGDRNARQPEGQHREGRTRPACW